MNSEGSGTARLRQRLAVELREFLVIAVYLYIYFGALIYFKAAILSAHGVDYAPWGIAFVKALICAKFVLIGRMFHLGDRYKDLPLIWPTLYQSFAFMVLLVVLNALEEVVAGFIHHRSPADIIAGINGGTLDQIIATSVLGMLIFVPFFAFRSLGELLGERNLVRVFIERRHKAMAQQY
jgi:hypothetical protein